MTKRKRLADTPSDDSAGGIYFDEPPLATFTSGCTLLDCALSSQPGGWAVNRFINIVGDNSTGKTLLAIEACANFHIKFPNGPICYLESEAAFDKPYAGSLGLPLDAVEFVEDVNTIEGMYKAIMDLIASLAVSGEHGLFIVDSLDALSDDAELKRDIEDGSYGLGKQKKLSELFRRLNKKMGTGNLTLMIVSQIRANINASFGNKYTRSGGMALDFYASQIVWLAHLGRLKVKRDGVERAIGVKIKAQVKKCKVGSPFRTATFPIIFEYGIEDVKAGVEWLLEVKQQKRINMTIEQAKLFVRNLHKMTREDYAESRDIVNEAVRAAWIELEARFKPTRSKYGNPTKEG